MVQDHSGFKVLGPIHDDVGPGNAGDVFASQGVGIKPKWTHPSDLAVDYGLAFEGIVTGVVAAPKFQCTNLIGFGDGFFDGYWSYVVWDVGGGGAAPQGQMLQCTGYASATGDFTVAAYAPIIAIGDHVLLLHPSIAEILAIHTELATVDGIVDNILLESQVRSITSASKAVPKGGSKYLHIDSGENHAEILSIIIYGLIGGDWTIGVYVPYADGAGLCVAADKKDTWDIVNTDAETGLIKPTAIAYDMCIDFNNTEAADGDRTLYVTVVYRSRGVLTLAWEA